MTTDQLAAIVAAAQEREGWKLHSHHHGSINHLHIIDGTLSVARFEERDNAAWTANAPRTIIALVERIRELEAQRDALEAHCAELENAGEWHRLEDELPPIDYRNKEGQFVYEESVEVEGLIAVPIHLCRWTYKDGTTEIVWDNKRANVRHRQVVGWKPLPKP